MTTLQDILEVYAAHKNLRQVMFVEIALGQKHELKWLQATCLTY